MEYLEYVQNTDWASDLQSSLYMYPLLLCIHALGMAMVVGTMATLSIRVLGYARAVPVSIFDTMLNVAWLGVALNAGSGAILFLINGVQLIQTWSFQLKLVLIVAGGVSVWLLWTRLRNEPGALLADRRASGRARVLAALTITFWFGAVIAGRLIAYTLPPL